MVNHIRGSRIQQVASAFALVAVLGACDDDVNSPANKTGRFFGEAVTVGNGNARAYINLQDGAPTELGVVLTEAAMNNLPANGNHGGGDHVNMTEYLLALPKEAAITPFRTVELDWNPGGHEPPGIYDLPHFDFHFYTISLNERNAIDPADPQFNEKAARLLAPQYTPAMYIAPAPVAVPRMGVHWVDPTSPELNGQTFTSTFIYGSYDSKLIFFEPMITREFIISRPQFSAEIRQPQQYEQAGWYPTRYTVRWDEADREYRISLTDFVKHGN